MRALIMRILLRAYGEQSTVAC